MKKTTIFLLTLSLILILPLSLVGCKQENVNYEKYKPSKYKESI